MKDNNDVPCIGVFQSELKNQNLLSLNDNRYLLKTLVTLEKNRRSWKILVPYKSISSITILLPCTMQIGEERLHLISAEISTGLGGSTTELSKSAFHSSWNFSSLLYKMLVHS